MDRMDVHGDRKDTGSNTDKKSDKYRHIKTKDGSMGQGKQGGQDEQGGGEKKVVSIQGQHFSFCIKPCRPSHIYHIALTRKTRSRTCQWRTNKKTKKQMNAMLVHTTYFVQSTAVQNKNADPLNCNTHRSKNKHCRDFSIYAFTYT